MVLLLATALWLAAQLVAVSGLHCEASPEWQELQHKMATMEKLFQTLQDKVNLLENQLQAVEKISKSVQGETSMLVTLQNKVNLLENQLQALEKISTSVQEKKVGFHVVMRPARMHLGLTYGGFGPFGDNQVVKYSEVITNVGNNYSPLTGVFTAPVDGLYFFAFTTCSAGLGQVMVGVQLIRNINEEVSFAAQYVNTKDEFMTNSAALVLKQGDLVYVRLPRGSQVSSSMRHMSNTFSGFLIHEL